MLTSGREGEVDAEFEGMRCRQVVHRVYAGTGAHRVEDFRDARRVLRDDGEPQVIGAVAFVVMELRKS